MSTIAGTPHHLALVGCGFTGTSAFFQLVDRFPVDEITIFEATGRFGPGYPYQPDECRDYLINNTNDAMCVVPSNRRAFIEWLHAHPDHGPGVEEKGHLPRAVFGEFLEEVFAATRTAAAVKGITVRLIPSEATAMREDAEGRVRIGWSGGEVIADKAILTTGRCPGVDRYEAPPPGAGARYIADQVGSSALDDVPLDATVHVLGASLSAYDVVNRLFSPETGCEFRREADGSLRFLPGANQRRVVLASRSGRLKKAQSRHPGLIRRRRFTREGLGRAAGSKGLSLESAAELIRQEAEEHGAEIDWQHVTNPYGESATGAEVNETAGVLLAADIEAAGHPEARNFLVDFFDDAQLDLWEAFAEQLLNPAEELRYRKQFETAALCYAAPCPIPTAERLLALHRTGRLQVIKGVASVAQEADGSAYEITHGSGVERAEILINTTGSVDRDVTSSRQPDLITDLVRRGLLQPYEREGLALSGAAVDMTTFRATGAKNIYLANMLLWGPGFFTSSAFMMATIVERLLDALFGDNT